MKGYSDFHTHTTFCDGKNTVREMVLQAVEYGMSAIGFSGHSYTFFDESYCMTKEGTKEYMEEVKRLRAEFSDRICVLCGVEQDLYSDADSSSFDYVIGSTHYFKFGDDYYPVDHSAAILRECADRYFGGDMVELAVKYFIEEAEVFERTHCDIIGHFDLISKFNEKENLFDENDSRYVASWQNAADILLKADRPFEINTGAISRGYRSTPYPSEPIYKYIKERGGHFILSGDTHKKEYLCCDFDKYEHLLH